MQSVKAENYFYTWLKAATNINRDWWERCCDASAARRALGGPTLEEMYRDYELLQAFGGSEFDPRDGHSVTDADMLIDAINEEIFARGPFEDCLTQELDRMLFNETRDCRSGLRVLVRVSLN